MSWLASMVPLREWSWGALGGFRPPGMGYCCVLSLYGHPGWEVVEAREAA